MYLLWLAFEIDPTVISNSLKLTKQSKKKKKKMKKTLFAKSNFGDVDVNLGLSVSAI
jgi:hypothetical protein